ncbi:MAG: intradiol ring-cleavage dioxygenase [Microbacterium sp.]
MLKPEPTQTDDGPAYEGRLLARPDDEVVDQGAGFDIRTLLSRRRVLGIFGIGAGAFTLAACAPSASGGTDTETTTSTGEIPDETAGPYPGDGSNGPNALTESGIVRSDIRSNIGASAPVDGVALSLTLTILDMQNDDAPFEGVAVYVWQCDGLGRYSMYSEGVEDDTFLRGVQVTDANGEVTFTTIVPGCYTGRWPHIHFEVYPDADAIDDAENAIAVSQVAVPEEILAPIYALDAYEGSSANLEQVSLDDDNVFGDDGGELQLATMSGDVDSGFTGTLTAKVDTETEPSGGAAPGGGGPGGGGGEPPADGEMPGEPPSGAPSAPDEG